MFMSLEEGIVVVKSKEISFANRIFQQILKRIKVDFEKERSRVADLKIFKIVRQGDGITENSLSEIHSRIGASKKSFDTDVGKTFSISQLLRKSQLFFRDKIFEVVEKQGARRSISQNS